MDKLQDKYKIGVICGDLRSVYMAIQLEKFGFSVCTYGLADDEVLGIKKVYDTPQRVIEESNVIILPLPVSKDNIYISSKSPTIKTKLTDIIPHLRDGMIIFGGILPKYFTDMCKDKGCFVFDYYKSEELVYKNATASAEGAIMIAMSNTHTTVKDEKYAILGFGRIATQLAYMLKAMGADVEIFARSELAIKNAMDSGYSVFKLEDSCTDEYLKKIACEIEKSSVVFNTIPSIILCENILNKLSKKPIYIELASAPGGIDVECARILKIKNIYAPSLPGRYAPQSAGKYIFEEILKSLYMIDSKEAFDI